MIGVLHYLRLHGRVGPLKGLPKANHIVRDASDLGLSVYSYIITQNNVLDGTTILDVGNSWRLAKF